MSASDRETDLESVPGSKLFAKLAINVRNHPQSYNHLTVSLTADVKANPVTYPKVRSLIEDSLQEKMERAATRRTKLDLWRKARGSAPRYVDIVSRSLVHDLLKILNGGRHQHNWDISCHVPEETIPAEWRVSTKSRSSASVSGCAGALQEGEDAQAPVETLLAGSKRLALSRVAKTYSAECSSAAFHPAEGARPSSRALSTKEQFVAADPDPAGATETSSSISEGESAVMKGE